VVLHNFLNQGGDFSFAETPEEFDSSEGTSSLVEPVGQTTAAGTSKRLAVMKDALVFRERGSSSE
jgi:hypothetical protein